MSAPLLPEFIGILGIDIFLLLSIVTCLFDLPALIQYVYHISAFVGLGQFWITNVFGINEETRFLVYAAYLGIGLANVIFINAYIQARDERIVWTTSFLCGITIPLLLFSFISTSLYLNKIPISLPSMPLIPIEVILATVFVSAITIVGSLIASSISSKRNNRFPPMRKDKEVRK